MEISPKNKRGVSVDGQFFDTQKLAFIHVMCAVLGPRDCNDAKERTIRMTHRTTEQDIGGFTSIDHADMDLRFLRLRIEDANSEHDTFTSEQGRDLTAIQAFVAAMIKRVRGAVQ